MHSQKVSLQSAIDVPAAPLNGAGKRIAAIVTDHAATTPSAVAIQDDRCAITYGELDSRAEHLARRLHRLGVGRDVVVGICLNRSVAMIVAMLAVLKAGGAYLPLDPTSPAARLKFALSDAEARAVLTSQARAEQLGLSALETVCLSCDGRDLGCACDNGGHQPSVEPGSNDLAYVIYTSGSTGQPKGVEIPHRSLENLVAWHCESFSLQRSDRASQIASPSFDAAVWEIWPYLVTGASLHIPSDETVKDPECLRKWLIERRITISFAPTPLAERLMHRDWPHGIALRFLLTGADTLRHHPPRPLPFALVNNYGPTECTVVATSGTVPAGVREDSLPPIGRPISNTTVYILDEHMNEVSPGTPGEIYIGGVGLARGYRNRPDLTAERFIANPFVQESGARLYRTGDMGTYLADGQIAFMGRFDDQVKIRGYRVELAEVDAALERHPLVRASLVRAHEDNGSKYLVAYIVPEAGTKPTSKQLRDYLVRILPEYMIPGIFYRLDSLPLTGSGKIDRTSLPPPGVAEPLIADVYIAPRTLVEEVVAAILSALLHVEHIGLNENFFLIGGNSLLGAQVIAHLRDRFGVHLPLRKLFDHPTVSELSLEIEQLLATKQGAA